MDASQYKDYVLVLLFVKYVSDNYAGQPYAPVTIPAGAGFADMAALKGKSDIGDQINKKILGIRHSPTSNATSVYDSTCGCGMKRARRKSWPSLRRGTGTNSGRRSRH